MKQISEWNKESVIVHVSAEFCMNLNFYSLVGLNTLSVPDFTLNIAVGREFMVNMGTPASTVISLAPANKNLQSRSLNPLTKVSSLEEYFLTC